MSPSSQNIASGKSQQFPIADIDAVFAFYRPRPPLSNFVDALWIHDGNTARRSTVQILPTGTLELVINLRQNELRFHDAKDPRRIARYSGAIISGAHGRGLSPADTDVRLIGVHFKPGGAFPFLGLPAGELADSHVDLDVLWGSATRSLRERACDASSHEERFCLLEEALLSRLYRGVTHHYAVSAALEMFGNNHIGPTVKDAAKYTGLSERRFIQAFKAEVGLTPKLFSRIQRFQRTRSFIQQHSSPDWAAVAVDLGYFDQSHLIREFTEFSGLTPTGYLDRLADRSGVSTAAIAA